LKVPKNTVAFIMLKWKKFGIAKTHPRDQGGDNDPDGHSDRALEFHCGDGRTFSAALHPSGFYGRVARRKPLLSKRHMTACLEFAKRHLKDSDHEKQDSLV
jgi:hypothetical protein